MMIIRVLTLLLVMLYSNITFPCTMGVAIGSATSDGRPLLWKTRDFEVKPNIVFYTKTDKFNFVSNITPEYGYHQSWYGLNEKGFAIANTFINDFPKGKGTLGNGELMNEALSNCQTITDFKNLLDSTNFIGRRTQATFGVIDTKGGAAIFEVGKDSYTMFDANNKAVAPDGYIIRSNFAESIGGNRGIERFNRSSELISGFRQSSTLSVKSILQQQMRDVGTNKENPDENGMYNCRFNICNPNSISATVIQGVKQHEPEQLSTMWTMLGNPFSSITVPYWVVGQTPEVSSSTDQSSLYETSHKLKSYVFSKNNSSEIHMDRMLEVKRNILETENFILNKASESLTKWRNTMMNEQEMLNLENKLANYACEKLKHIYSSTNNEK